MSPLQRLLLSLGYGIAAQHLKGLPPAREKELLLLWKAWAAAPKRAPSVLEICGAPLPQQVNS